MKQYNISQKVRMFSQNSNWPREADPVAGVRFFQDILLGQLLKPAPA